MSLTLPTFRSLARVAPRGNTRVRPGAVPRHARDNPSGKNMLLHGRSGGFTASVGGSPLELLSDLYEAMVLHLGAALAGKEPAWIGAALAYAFLETRLAAARDNLVTSAKWPDEKTRLTYEGRVQTVMDFGSTFLRSPPDMADVFVRMQRAMAEMLQQVATHVAGIGVEAVFYVDHLLGALDWDEDIRDTMRAWIVDLYREDMPLIAQRATIHYAYHLGTELLSVQPVRVGTNPYAGMPMAEQLGGLNAWLGDDTREYLHHDPPPWLVEYAHDMYDAACANALPFLLNPNEWAATRPFE
jgi:hypothetical protein